MKYDIKNGKFYLFSNLLAQKQLLNTNPDMNVLLLISLTMEYDYRIKENNFMKEKFFLKIGFCT